MGMEDPQLTQARERMVQDQIEARGVTDQRVLAAIRLVPRHRFVPEAMEAEAYADHPLPIGHGQTISQPYIVAFMAEALALKGHERVLEIGSGSGYMAAVLSQLCKKVLALELETVLAKRSQRLLQELGIENVQVRCADGCLGAPEEGGFDAILFSCAAPELRAEWKQQLLPHGRIVLPLGPPGGTQELIRITRRDGADILERFMDVCFVPLR